MSLRHVSLVTLLMVGGSSIALSIGGIAAAASGDPPAPRFGAPALPTALGGAAGTTSPFAADSEKALSTATWAVSKPRAQDPGSPGDQGSKEPNLGALRYYAATNDLARVAAELRLLRAKYPGWEPPADLFTESKDGESEQPLWDLFAKHDLDGLKAAIAQRQQETPGWQPSADLGTKLANAESYAALVQASDQKDYGTVVDIAAANHGLLTCGNVDAMWRSAEALALTSDETHAVDVYRYILSTCTVPQERLATMQKASLLIKSPEAIDVLVRMGKRLPNGKSEFAELVLDGSRQRIGDAASGRSTVQPSQGDLDQLAARAHAPGGGKDAELLGWYTLSRKDYPGAEAWFRTAMEPTPTAKAAEGLVLALRDGGKMPEAVKLAPQYASLGQPNRKLMMEVMVANLATAKELPSADTLASLGAAIEAEKSADAAQSFAWSRFKANDVAGSEEWFKKSLAWQPNEAAAVGLMLTARRLKHAADYAAAVTQYKATYPRVAELDRVMKVAVHPAVTRQAQRAVKRHVAAKPSDGWDQSATAIVQTFEAGNAEQALAMMDARRATRPEPKGLTVVRGWALYKKGDWEEAKQVFTDVGSHGMADEAAKGLQQIERGYTNPRFR